MLWLESKKPLPKRPLMHSFSAPLEMPTLPSASLCVPLKKVNRNLEPIRRSPSPDASLSPCPPLDNPRLVIPVPSKSHSNIAADPHGLPSPSSSDTKHVEEGTMPWNARSRAPVPSSKLSVHASMPSDTTHAPHQKDGATTMQLRSRDPEGKRKKKRVRDELRIALTKEEIEDDFIKITGSKPPRHPRRRPPAVRKLLEGLHPDLLLRKVLTPDRYRSPGATGERVL